MKGDAFEYFLKNSVSVVNDSGEYFTPRHVVKLLVDMEVVVPGDWLASKGLTIIRKISSVLHEKMKFSARLPGEIAGKLTSQFKSMAGPGAAATFVRTIDGRTIRFCLNCLPTVSGEKIALGICDPQVAISGLSRLNLTRDEEKRLRRLLGQSCGLVVLAAEPRFGRDEAFGAMAGELMGSGRNVASIGVSLEASIEGVTHCLTEAGRTHQTIRAAAAADTDALLIDELPDAASVPAAIEAAGQGCLVVAGIPAKNARAALARVLAAGAEPWPLASSLLAVVALRTARRLCDDCKTPAEPVRPLLAELGVSAEQLSPSACSAGRCEKCGRTGYVGVTGLLSVLEVDEAIAELIRRRADVRSIEEAAVKAGMKPLAQAAIEKLNAGLTTQEEIWRVLP